MHIMMTNSDCVSIFSCFTTLSSLNDSNYVLHDEMSLEKNHNLTSNFSLIFFVILVSRCMNHKNHAWKELKVFYTDLLTNKLDLLTFFPSFCKNLKMECKK